MKGLSCSALLFVSVILVVGLNAENLNPCKYVQDNAFIDNPESCKSYFKCVNGQSLAHDCPNNLYFDKFRGTCEPKSNVKCEEKVPINPCSSADLTFVNDPKSCKSFFYCNNGVPESYDCPDGLIFNPDSKECVYPHTYNCDDKVPPPEKTKICVGVPNGVFIRDSTDCSKFYVCVQEVETALACASEAYFNLKTGTCDVKESVECKLEEEVVEVCNGIEDGDFVKDSSSCAGWLQCMNNEVKTKGTCPENQWFVSDSSACNWWWLVSEDECQNRCENKMYGFVVAPGTACKEYYNCKDGKLNSGKMECPDDLVFDIKNEHCVPKDLSSPCIAP